MTASAWTPGSLSVPGARLHYQTRGAGPLLVVLPGGDGDADASDALAEQLAGRFTVVTHDRRGLSRSALDAPPAGHTLSTHGDDVHALLAHLGRGPAHVVGSSMGAMVGLDLLARHPGDVVRLVAHEPPASSLLDDDERRSLDATHAAIEATRRSTGPLPAMRRFIQLVGMRFDDREPDVTLPAFRRERLANIDFFLAHDVPAVRDHDLDLTALAAHKNRLVVAAGSASGDAPYARPAHVLAARLGVACELFPGAHNGFWSHPRAFAERLIEVLTRG